MSGINKVDRHRAGTLLLIVLTLLCLFSTAGQAASPGRTGAQLELNPAEQAWLDSHSSIRVGVDKAYAPYSFRNEHGQYEGIAVDYLDWLSAQAGIEFEIVPDLTWEEILAAAKSGAIDVIATAVLTPEREEYLDFTEGYLPTPLVIMAGKDNSSITCASDLDGITVSLVKGYSSSDRVLEDHPTVNPLWVTDPLQGLLAVSTGEAEAYIGVIGVNLYTLNTHGITNLKVAAGYSDTPNTQRLAIREDWPELVSILDKALDRMTEDERQAIMSRWLPMSRTIPSHDELRMTEDEMKWLLANPTVTIGCQDDWAPFDFVDDDGNYSGITADYLTILSDRTGLEIVPVTHYTWNEILEQAGAGHIDLVANIVETPSRREYLDFTQPYFTSSYAIVAREDSPEISGMASLDRKTVAIEEGFFLQGVLETEYPAISTLPVQDTREALAAVSSGDADAYIGNRAVSIWLIEKLQHINLKLAADPDLPATDLRFGIRQDCPELAGILEKGLESITQAEHQVILNKWVGIDNAPDTYRHTNLTAEERDWLDRHPVIRMGVDRDFVPFEFIDDSGSYSGIAADYIEILSERLGFEVVIVEDRSWSDVIGKARTRDLDLLPVLYPTEPRREFLRFTDPVAESPTMIFTSKDARFVGGMSDLYGDAIAVIDGGYAGDLLATEHPDTEIHRYPTARAALTAISLGEEVAYVGSLAGGAHVIEQYGLANVKVAAPYDSQAHLLCMGVRSDWPEFVGILNKGLRSISPEEAKMIRQRWVAIRYEYAADASEIVGWIMLVAGIAAVVIGVIWFWNRSLQKEILHRHQVEADLIVARDKAESADRLKSAFLATMSHELRTPLNSIIGFTGILLQELPGPLNDEQKTQMGLVKTSSRHLLSLINDILDISKIESGQLKLVMKPFNLGDSIRQVGDSLAPLAEENGLTLTISVDRAVGEINSDQRRVEQVLINLINNAIKFTESGGVDVVACRDDSPGQPVYRVSVIDTGIGIRPEDQEKIFTKFHQLESGLSRTKEGTGLGLSISRKLIDMLHGNLTLTSEWGAGSTFSFTLPLDGTSMGETDG